jgi:glycolate oxidase iron-sulfur subunit
VQTNLADFIKGTADGDEAEAILRACVHCGFCTATCPTYQLLGDELDGPRGRIYLIKQVLEGQPATSKTQQHLDRCLTCRSCETTCPSGVEYGRLLDIGRKIVDQQVPRPATQRLVRGALKYLLPRPALFNPAMKIGQFLRPMLPQVLREKIPAAQEFGVWPTREHGRKMLLLDGCVQPAMAPNINFATARVLDALEVQLIVAPKAGCCGAIHYHLNDQETGLDDMRNNIDAWWPFIESGAEAIVMTASGCGVTVKEYAHLLAHDPAYAGKAKRVADMTRDLSEILAEFESELIERLSGKISKRIAWHPPCTLQHGQKIKGKVESLLRNIGVDVHLCVDSHLCCGSAGTYSVLQANLSGQMRENKLHHLHASEPEVILSANIGCLTHLQAGTETPVRHWVELLDHAFSELATQRRDIA